MSPAEAVNAIILVGGLILLGWLIFKAGREAGRFVEHFRRKP